MTSTVTLIRQRLIWWAALKKGIGAAASQKKKGQQLGIGPPPRFAGSNSTYAGFLWARRALHRFSRDNPPNPSQDNREIIVTKMALSAVRTPHFGLNCANCSTTKHVSDYSNTPLHFLYQAENSTSFSILKISKTQQEAKKRTVDRGRHTRAQKIFCLPILLLAVFCQNNNDFS